MSASIFSGSIVKVLKAILNMNDAAYIVTGSVDPSAGAGVDAPAGSLYLRSNGAIYKKQLGGLTAWIEIITTGDTQSLSNKSFTAPQISNYEEFVEQGSDPSSPSSGKLRVYAKSSDKSMYQKDSSGNVKKLGYNAATVNVSDIQNTLDIAFQITGDFQGEPVTLAFPQYTFSINTKLSDPATLPTGAGEEAHFSPCGEYLAVAHTTSPFVTIYQRKGIEFVKLANPATLPTGSGEACRFSPDGQFLAVGHATSPFITIYQRSGSTFTKLANPATLPTGTVFGVSWSPNGEFLTCGHTTTPFITTYQRSGTTFTKLADPATLPPGNSGQNSWSPDGRFLAICSGSSTPQTTIYERTAGTTFTKLADPSGINLNSGNTAIGFSPNGEFLAIAGGNNTTGTSIRIYQRSGTTFTSVFTATGADHVGGLCWDLNSDFVVFGIADDCRIVVYRRSGTTFTLVNSVLLTGTGDFNFANVPCFSPDRQFIAAASDVTPYIFIFQTTSTMPSNPVLTMKKVMRDGQ